MIGVLSLMIFGGVCGFLLGAAAAAFTRDGIWPEVWAGLILAGGLIGMFVGLLALLFQ